MEDKLEKELFELICYMIVSARNLDQETKMYGPFRLVDATSKLIEILEKNGIYDEFFSQVKTIIEANKYKVMTDKEGFIAFLDDLLLRMVVKLEEAG
jgi:thymidine phosphorylase